MKRLTRNKNVFEMIFFVCLTPKKLNP